MEWVQVLTVVGANIGTVLALLIWARTEAATDRREAAREAAEDRRQIQSFIKEGQEDRKAFHGKLEKQDAEFRTRFLAIEENRAKEQSKIILESLRAR